MLKSSNAARFADRKGITLNTQLEEAHFSLSLSYLKKGKCTQHYKNVQHVEEELRRGLVALCDCRWWVAKTAFKFAGRKQWL